MDQKPICGAHVCFLGELCALCAALGQLQPTGVTILGECLEETQQSAPSLGASALARSAGEDGVSLDTPHPTSPHWLGEGPLPCWLGEGPSLRWLGKGPFLAQRENKPEVILSLYKRGPRKNPSVSIIILLPPDPCPGPAGMHSMGLGAAPHHHLPPAAGSSLPPCLLSPPPRCCSPPSALATALISL